MEGKAILLYEQNKAEPMGAELIKLTGIMLLLVLIL